MKARLIKQQEIYKLLFCTGDISTVGMNEIREFFCSFNDVSYYVGNVWDHEDVTIETFSGETIAYVDEDMHLFICKPDILIELLSRDIGNYVPVEEYAEQYGKQGRIIRKFCNDGRIPNAELKGNMWLVPKNAPYPKDARAGRRVGVIKY